MILSELRTYSRNSLDEVTAALFTDTNIDAWINEAERDIAAKTGCIEIISQLTTTIGSRLVEFVGNKVNAVELYVSGTYNFVPGTGVIWEDTDDSVWQDLSTMTWYDSTKDLWVPYPGLGNLHVTPHHLGHISARGLTSPQYWFQWGNYIVIEPTPDAIYTINAYVTQSPTSDFVADIDESELPLEFQEAIPLYVTFTGLLKARRYGDSAVKYGEYIYTLQTLIDKYIRRKASRIADIRLPDLTKVR